jgi:hypothetical protein
MDIVSDAVADRSHHDFFANVLRGQRPNAFSCSDQTRDSVAWL